uniref:Candidate secreted effector n=1 Tax=Meloidogyne incognita TaxID=6306 RepID=A0A914M6R0_MELIC
MDNNQQQQLEIENKEKESPKDSGKKKVKFETSSDSSGDDFEMVQSAKNDGVIKNDAQAKCFGLGGLGG